MVSLMAQHGDVLGRGAVDKYISLIKALLPTLIKYTQFKPD